MANLPDLKKFAAEHNFGLTNPLSHEQVVLLAETWKPEMHFHWDEKFFPISLHEAISMVEDGFAALPPTEKNDWRVVKFIRTGTANVVGRAFDPPVVYVPDGGVSSFFPTVRVLNDGSSAGEALGRTEVGGAAVVTHGASVGRSNKFFGPLTTVNGNEKASEGDPYLPRAEEPVPNSPDRRPYYTVMASLVNLVDLLKYELTIAEANDVSVDAYPPDGMRGGFDVVDSLLRPTSTAPPLTAAMKRQLLLAQIASFESGGTIPPPALPVSWRLDRVAWNALIRYAFLEYDFFYAYNDFNRYPQATVTLFTNEHEGDDEGCCLVFDRGAINLAAASSDPVNLLKWVVPFAVITSVHEESQNADLFKEIEPPLPVPPGTADSVRKLIGFDVYIAGGSHATYLTSGNHPLVDVGDFVAVAEDNLLGLIALAPVVVPTAILLLILEHFLFDTQDFTSDDGIHGAAGEPVEDDPLGVANRVIVLPMSAGNHIYDGQGEHDELLRLRAYAGKWGGHDGLINHSPTFHAKTGRYFRKLLNEF